MQTQLVRNHYGISLYQVQAKGIMTIFHIVGRGPDHINGGTASGIQSQQLEYKEGERAK